jgi:hypothetical protein
MSVEFNGEKGASKQAMHEERAAAMEKTKKAYEKDVDDSPSMCHENSAQASYGCSLAKQDMLS